MTESDTRATAPYTDAAHAGVGDGLRGMRGGRPRALERRRLLQQEEKRQWGDAWKDTGRIFTEEDGSLLHPGKISDLFERLVAEAGLPPVRLHDLRHGAATLMPAASVDIKVSRRRWATATAASRATSTSPSSTTSRERRRRPSSSSCHGR